MSYKAFLNNTELIFDTTLQDDEILLVDPVVKIEAGSAGSFDFSMPETHTYYQNLHRAIDMIDVYRDGEEDPIFSGRVYQIQDTINGLQKISCEGAMTFLADTIYRPVTFSGQLHTLVSNIIINHNGQVESSKQIIVGTLTITNSTVYREYLNYETSISRLKDLVESFGGYMMIRKHSGTYYLDWLDDFTTPCTQKVELGSNILDIKKTVNSNDICTVLIPLGAKDSDGNRLTIKSVNSNKDYLVADAAYITEYGYITKTAIWDDVTTASALKTKGQAALTAALVPKSDITLKAVDLTDAGYTVDSFRVGQKISVTSIPNGLNAVFFSCIRQTLRLLDPGQNTLELGEVKEGYVQSFNNTLNARVSEAISTDVTRAISNATALITGNKGGYVVLHDSNGDTYPDEILVMDTADISTAVKVWRWNNSGLGYSSTGYNGTYGLAMTMDGTIAGSFIAAASISADKISVTDLQAIGATIGGFDIDSTSIHTHGVLITSNANNSVGLSSSTFTRIIGGTSRSNLKFAIGSNFGVTTDGTLYADSLYSKNANITGGNINIEANNAYSEGIKLKYSTTFSCAMAPNGISLYGLDNYSNPTHLSLLSEGVFLLTKINNTYEYTVAMAGTRKPFIYFTSFTSNNNAISTMTLGGEYYGDARFYNSSNNETVHIDGSSGIVYCTSTSPLSDKRLKDDIRLLDYEKSTQFVYSLKPSLYKIRSCPNGYHHGFIAQDVEALLDKIYGNSKWRLIEKDEHSRNQYKHLSYTELIADIVATLQSQNERLIALETA